MIGENYSSTDVFVFVFFESAAPNPKKNTFSPLSLSHSFLGLGPGWSWGGIAVQYLPN
jgi:hypothetical protein